MKRRWDRWGFPRRNAPELHPGPTSRGYVPFVDGAGAETEYSLEEGTARRLPRGRQRATVAAGLVLVAAITGYFVWADVHGFLDFLGAMGAMGRIIWLVVGSLAFLGALAYYYTAGIDWPRDEAYRIIAIGASIGLAIVLLVLLLVSLEGRIDEVWPSLWRVGLALAVAAAVGWIGQRSGA
jgi:hypothetical protein